MQIVGQKDHFLELLVSPMFGTFYISVHVQKIQTSFYLKQEKTMNYRNDFRMKTRLIPDKNAEKSQRLMCVIYSIIIMCIEQ